MKGIAVLRWRCALCQTHCGAVIRGVQAFIVLEAQTSYGVVFPLVLWLTRSLDQLPVDARNTLNDLLSSTDVKIFKGAELRHKKI